MSEPIAVVGMACRFPGAPDLASFWRLLIEGKNAVTEGVPGSGEGRVGQLYPQHRSSKRRLPVWSFHRRDRPI